MDEQTRRERLADLCHRQWSGWMAYLFEKSLDREDGAVVIPAWAVERWRRQVATPYAELSEEERESDRKEADRFIALINGDQEAQEAALRPLLAILDDLLTCYWRTLVGQGVSQEAATRQTSQLHDAFLDRLFNAGDTGAQ